VAYTRLLAGLQESVGPVYGEGAFGLWQLGYDSFYAGHLDAVWRTPSTGSPDPGTGSFLVAPDYELQVVRPRTVGFGMGPYERLFGTDVLSVLPLSDEALDRERALMLAFGHAGSWQHAGPGGDPWLSPAEEVKAYHLMSALQRRYLDSTAATVTYVGPDGEGDLDWALATGLDLGAPRLRLSFDRLSVWVNTGAETWRVPEAGGHDLPRDGWLATGDDGLLAYSALSDGRRVDMLSAPELALIDGRGETFAAAGLAGTDLVVRLADGRRIEELPDGTLRVTP
jgi:hypothetical protein